MSVLSALKDHLMTAIATSAVLGGGGMLISTRINDARQDQQIATAMAALPEIQKDTKATREAVIRLAAQEEVRRTDRRNSTGD